MKLNEKTVLVIDAKTFINPKYSLRELQGIVKCIISSQLALHSSEQVKYTKYYKHTLKKTLNASIRELIAAEKEGFDTFIDSDIEVQAIAVHDVLFTLIELIGLLEFTQYPDLIRMIQAYKLDDKSVMGITKKIIKNEKTHK